MILINVQIDETSYKGKPSTKDAGDVKGRLLTKPETYQKDARIDQVFHHAHLRNKTTACGACQVESEEELARVNAERARKGKQPAKGICEESFNPERGGANYFLFDIDNDRERYKRDHPNATEKDLPPLITPQTVIQILDQHGLHANTGYETSSSVKWKDEETGVEYPSRFRFGIATKEHVFSAEEFKQLGGAIIGLFPKGYIDSSTNHIDAIFFGAGEDKGETAAIPELIDFENYNSLASMRLLAGLSQDKPAGTVENIENPPESEYRALFRTIEKNYREKGTKPVIKEGSRWLLLRAYAYDALNLFDPHELELAKHDFDLMASFCEGDFKAEAEKLWADAVRDAPTRIYSNPNRVPRSKMKGILSKITSRFILYTPDNFTKVDAYNNPINLTPQDPETIAEARAKRLEVLKAKTPFVKDAVDQFWDDITDGSFYYVSTGFPELDRILGRGVYPGLHIVGAETGIGKTTLGLQITDYMASHGHDVIFVELEMKRTQLMARSVSRQSYLNSIWEGTIPFEAQEILDPTSEKRKQPEAQESLEQAVREYTEKTGKCLRFCCELSETTTDDIRQLVEDHINEYVKEDSAEENRKHRPVVIVDYLQILRALNDLSTTDKQKIDFNINDLKLIADSCRIPIISISSLNRSAYGEPASLSALKETGSIEYTADTIWIIQIDGADLKSDESQAKRRARISKLNERVGRLADEGRPVWLEVKILKNRFGKKGKVPLDYIAKYNYFSEGNYEDRKSKRDFYAQLAEAEQQTQAQLNLEEGKTTTKIDKEKKEASNADSAKPYDPLEVSF